MTKLIYRVSYNTIDGRLWDEKRFVARNFSDAYKKAQQFKRRMVTRCVIVSLVETDRICR